MLVRQKADQLGKAILGVKVGGRDSDKDKSKLSVELAKELELQTGVKDLLKSDQDFKNNVKGETGLTGPRGTTGATGLGPVNKI